MLEFLSLDLTDNIAILIIIIMCFFSLFLLNKNKKLKTEIEDLKLGDRILASKFKKMEADVVSIDNISKEDMLVGEHDSMKKDNDIKNDSKILSKEFSISEDVKEIKADIRVRDVNKFKKRDANNKLYSKNVLHDSPKVTSPISLDVEKVSFKADEFVKKDKKRTFNEGKKVDRISASDYLREISNAIADEIKPQTIELTDYEKAQEENAIISYKELLNASKINNNDNIEEETLEFIEELKKFRNSLN